MGISSENWRLFQFELFYYTACQSYSKARARELEESSLEFGFLVGAKFSSTAEGSP